MRSAWIRLQPIASDDSIPPLLVKYEIGSSDYSIWITDLTAIWVESLARKRVIQRSFAIDTSIDPSEGPDQFRLLLQSIEKAIKQQSGTILSLVQNGSDQNLLLRTHTPLPGSLRPLEWEFELALAPSSVLTAEFVLPMLSHQVLGNIEQASLLQLLKEKDQVISKLTDKIQSDGTDLGRVFPSITSSRPGRANSRQLLGKSVKGLEEFDEQQWRTRLMASASVPKGFGELIAKAFEGGLTVSSGNAPISTQTHWWKGLRHRDSQMEQPRQSYQVVVEEGRLTPNEFQEQLTPLKMHQSAPIKAESHVKNRADTNSNRSVHSGNNSTTDESDHDSESSPSTTPFSHAKAAENGGLNKSPEVASLRTSAESSGVKGSFEEPGLYQDTVRSHWDNGEKLESASSFSENTSDCQKRPDRDLKSAIGDNAIQASATPKPKAKLGRIGGKSKGTESSRAQPGAHGRSAGLLSKQDHPLHQRNQETLEASGATSDNGDSIRIDRTNAQTRTHSPPRESSRDRANKKREQLKRELQSKSNAGVKKKRKF